METARNEKVTLKQWKIKQARMLWESLIQTEDVTKMIEEADDVGHTLILKLLGHCLNKGTVLN